MKKLIGIRPISVVTFINGRYEREEIEIYSDGTESLVTAFYLSK